MEGRVLLECGECDVRREIVGEIPEEYTRCFAQAVAEDGWAPRPGVTDHKLICGACLVKEYGGHESRDDEEKVQGRRDPMEP
ncbi:MAG TPA: hypothetical protein VJZ00_18715 [Thermoanaerobaculia bacterium]|nr:hypothetical protein [Thermoanaerobaculia bacterium]